jgi:UDP-glucose 4-epimerase
LTRSKSRIELVPYAAYYGEGFEDMRRRVPAVDKARQHLGFRPQVGLEAGLRKTIAWCRAHFSH